MLCTSGFVDDVIFYILAPWRVTTSRNSNQRLRPASTQGELRAGAKSAVYHGLVSGIEIGHGGSYSNTTVYYRIHERRGCIPVDCGVTNLIRDRRSCVDFTLEFRRMWLDMSTQA